MATQVELINLTPHSVIVNGVKIPASGQIARFAEQEMSVFSVISNNKSIMVSEYQIADVYGLPECQPGKRYIVSKPICMVCTDRTDIYFPDKLVRDDKGNIIGCESLGRYPADVEYE